MENNRIPPMPGPYYPPFSAGLVGPVSDDLYAAMLEAHAQAEAAETAHEAAETAQEAAETAQGKAEDAQEAAETAQGKAEDAQDAAEDAQSDAEAYGAGTRGGAAVGSSDPAYHNNAKYYSEQAAESAATLVPDPTLTEENQPAEAAATGIRFGDIENALQIVHAKWEQGAINSDGVAYSANYAIRTDYIPTAPDEQFIKYDLQRNAYIGSYYFYNASKTFLVSNHTGLAPENAAYMRTMRSLGSTSGQTIEPSDGQYLPILRMPNILSVDVGGRALFKQYAASHVLDIDFPVSSGDKVAWIVLNWDGEMPDTFSLRGMNGDTASGALNTASGLYECNTYEFSTSYEKIRIRADVSETPSSSVQFNVLLFKVDIDKISPVAYSLAKKLNGIVDNTLSVSGKAADAQATGARINDIDDALRVVHAGWEQGNINASGENLSANYAIRTGYIPCEPGEQFVKYSLSSISRGVATDWCYFYDSSKTFIERNHSNIAPENAAFMRTIYNLGSGNVVVPADGKNVVIMRTKNVLSVEVGGRAFFTSSSTNYYIDVDFPVAVGDKIACMVLEWGGETPMSYSVRGLNDGTATAALGYAENLYECFTCDFTTAYPQLRIRADGISSPSSAVQFSVLVFKVGYDKVSALAYSVGKQAADTNFAKVGVTKALTAEPLGTAQWSQGTISDYGGLVASTITCRSKYLYGYDFATIISLQIADGYMCKVMEFTSQTSATTSTFSKQVCPYTEHHIEFTPVTGYAYYLTIAKTDSSDITPSDLPSDCVVGTIYTNRTAENETLTYAMDVINILAESGDNEVITWEQGSISISSGGNINADNRIRSRHYLTYNSLKYLYIYCPEGYQVVVRMYEQSDAATFLGSWSPTFKSGMIIVKAQVNVMYRIVVRRTDDEDITPEQVPEGLRVIPVFLPYWSKDAHGNSVATVFTHRSNPTYVEQIIAVAQSYYDHRNDKTNGSYDMVYGWNSAVRQDTYTRQIDCSTYVGLVLRGLAYTDTQYYTHQDTPRSAVVANPEYVWSFNPQYYDYYSQNLTEEPTDATVASQLGEWMIDMGWRVPIDKKLLNLEPGDIIFWANRSAKGVISQPDRFMSISHVAICISKTPTESGDGYYEGGFNYTHTFLEVTSVTPCVRTGIAEEGWDDAAPYGTRYKNIALICRPDLGSI